VTLAFSRKKYMKKVIILIAILAVLFAGIFWIKQSSEEISISGLPDVFVVQRLIEQWPVLEKTFPARPVLGSTKWNYPTIIQFLSRSGKDALLVEYDDGHILHYSILYHDGEGRFIFEETLPEDKLTEGKWQALRDKYSGDGEVVTFVYTPSNTETAVPSDWKKISDNPFAMKGESVYENREAGVKFNYSSDFTISKSNDTVFGVCKDFGGAPPYSGCVSFVKILNVKNSLDNLLIGDVVFDGSGMHPNSINDFEKISMGENEYLRIKVGRFEGVLTYNYYLPKGSKVFVFSFAARGVDWTNPELDEEIDPTHLELKKILRTVEIESADRGSPQTQVPITPPSPSVSNKPCVISGCSSEVCAEDIVMSTCEFKDEYVCLKYARCERQTGGKCGWTETPEYKRCYGDTLFN